MTQSSGDTGHGALPFEPALDGLRGVAVAAVLLFHGQHLTGGYLGVDAFFVLSGFLITSLLLNEHDRTQHVSLRRFWARRARRLLPALACILVAVAAYAAFAAHPEELAAIRSDALATIGYFANWRAIFSSHNYFDLFRSPSPLQHTWSLAIEEQFYVLWPLVVVLLVRGRDARRASGRVLAAACAGAVASFVLAQILFSTSGSTRVYYGTDTRLGAILAGAALAAAVARFDVVAATRRRRLEVAAIIAIAILGVAWARLGGESTLLYRGGLVLSALAVVLVIAAATHPRRGVVHAALALPPLRAIGRISYGLYLWHWPVYVFLDEDRTGKTGWSLLALQLAATCVLALLSYRLVEQPIRHGAGSTSMMIRAVPATAVVLVVALFVTTSGESLPIRASWIPHSVPVRGSASWNASLAEYRRAAALATAAHKTRVLVIGDSVALSLGFGNDTGVYRRDRIAGSTLGLIGCSIVSGALVSGGEGRLQNPDCNDWLELYADTVAAFRPNVVMVMLGPWEMFDHEQSGRVVRVGTHTARGQLLASLDRLLPKLTRGGARVVMLTTPCMTETRSTIPGANKVFRDAARRQWVNGVWHDFAASHAGTVGVAPFDRYLCPNGMPHTLAGGTAMRSDGLHFTPQGAAAVWHWIAASALASR